MKIEITMFKGFEGPKGWELTGEFRKPHPGEHVLLFEGTGVGVSMKVCSYSSYSEKDWLTGAPCFIVRPKHWRAKKNGKYFSINPNHALNGAPRINEEIEYFDNWDNGRHSCGNYFATYKEAEHALSEVRRLMLSLSTKGGDDEN